MPVYGRWKRTSRGDDPAHEFGIPQFLDQLIKTLEVEQTSEPMRSREISGTEDGKPAVSEIASTAARHGNEMLMQGFSVEQVVHDYGDLCQAITGLAFEQNTPIQADEFQTRRRSSRTPAYSPNDRIAGAARVEHTRTPH